MYVLTSVTMAAAPALALVWYFYKKDVNRLEPKGLVLKVFIMGALSTFAALALELLLGYLAYPHIRHRLVLHAFRAFAVAGFCEEYIKLRVVKRFAYNKPAFDEVMDGIVYAAVASLGFACFENIIYVMGGGVQTALLRAFTAVPGHAMNGGMMGYFIGRAKFARTRAGERALIATGLLIAVLLHGTYDFLLFASVDYGSALAFGILPLLVVMALAMKMLIKRAVASDALAGRA